VDGFSLLQRIRSVSNTPTATVLSTFEAEECVAAVSDGQPAPSAWRPTLACAGTLSAHSSPPS
jgi:hypothetical protein